MYLDFVLFGYHVNLMVDDEHHEDEEDEDADSCLLYVYSCSC